MPTQESSPLPVSSAPLGPEHWQCDQCSEHAECFQNVCVCKHGWSGDGIECNYNCADDSVWSVDQCIPINGDDEEEIEVQPFCSQKGCSCPTGYELFEYAISQSCRLISMDETRSNGSIDDDKR